MIKRLIEDELVRSIKPNHVTGIIGARRVGKTVLMESVREKLGNEKVLLVQGDNMDVAEILSSQRKSLLEQFVKGYSFLFIDEAQEIHNIGASLKLLVDTVPGISVFITGSSAFDIRNATGAPLTGRSTFFHLYPFSQTELNENFLEARSNLEQRLIYGSYPQVYNSPDNNEKRKILEGIKDGYLLKDLLQLGNLKDSLFVLNLLRLLAFQIGNEVSYTELGRSLNADNKTVKRYLKLLEKIFVLFSLNGYSNNLRKEYTKSPRYYFWDNGIRNTIISNFNNPLQRDDVGKLWENYWIAERLKYNHYTGRSFNAFFWRTYDQKEIDYIEEAGGKLTGFEIKWGKGKARNFNAFLKAYPNADTRIINKDTYLEYLG
jgi:hypothetical protein